MISDTIITFGDYLLSAGGYAGIDYSFYSKNNAGTTLKMPYAFFDIVSTDYPKELHPGLFANTTVKLVTYNKATKSPTSKEGLAECYSKERELVSLLQNRVFNDYLKTNPVSFLKFENINGSSRYDSEIAGTGNATIVTEIMFNVIWYFQ